MLLPQIFYDRKSIKEREGEKKMIGLFLYPWEGIFQAEVCNALKETFHLTVNSITFSSHCFKDLFFIFI